MAAAVTVNADSIVVFDEDSQDHTEFMTDHITLTELRGIVSEAMMLHPKMMVRKFMRKLLSHPRNKCVKKTSRHNKRSSVHVGAGKWETRMDNEVYPYLVKEVANAFLEVLDGKQRMLPVAQHHYQELSDMLEHLMNGGYAQDTEREARLHKLYTELQATAVCIALDIAAPPRG